MTTFNDWLGRAVDTARDEASGAASRVADTAVGSAMDALTRAVESVRSRRLPYSVTVGVTLGPVELSVTVEGQSEADWIVDDVARQAEERRS